VVPFYSSTARSLIARGVTKDTEFDRAAPYLLPGVDANGNPNRVQTSATQAFFNNGFGPDESGMFDATLIRLREMSLSYSLPENCWPKHLLVACHSLCQEPISGTMLLTSPNTFTWILKPMDWV